MSIPARPYIAGNLYADVVPRDHIAVRPGSHDCDSIVVVAADDIPRLGARSTHEIVRRATLDAHSFLGIAEVQHAAHIRADVIPGDHIKARTHKVDEYPRAVP
jgi:hypothetical protein